MTGLQGRVLGGFQLGELIGSGGIAEVYRGRPTRAGTREVAIKVIYPEFARQPGFLPNFRRIVDMSAKLANHPHILPLLASGEDNGYLYLVTPYVSGGTLRDWLQSGGRLGAGDVAPFFRQLCAAVAYAHSLGVIHGNLKPSNVFLFEGRHILLGDFGLLWDIRQLDMNHVGSGTEAVEYLAPEAFEGQITQAGDLYSLGAVLFATLVGHPPFTGLKPADIYAAHRHQPVPHLAQADRTLPPPVLVLDPVIQRAMAKAPDDRFPAATQLAQAIETALKLAPAEPLGGPVPVGSPAVQQAWSLGMETGFLGGPPAASMAGASGWVNGPLGAAPGLPAVAPPSGGAGLSQVNPPFPPLGPSERPDAQMEVGRPDFALGSSAALAHEATERIPAPRTIGEASSRSAVLSDLLTSPMASSVSPDPGPTMRVPAPAVEQPAWAPVPPSPSQLPPGGQWPARADDEAQVAQRLPAIRPVTPSRATGGWPPGDAPLGDDRFDPPGASQIGAAPGGRYVDAGAGVPALPPEDPRSAAGRSSAYSASELGLPRLTMPELPDMAPDWSAELGDPYGSRSSAYGDGYPAEPGYSAEYRAVPRPDLDQAPAYPAADQWEPGGESAQWSAAYPSYGMPAGVESRAAYGRSPAALAEQGSFSGGLTDQRVWTEGHTAIRARRRRQIRNLLMAVILVLVVLGGPLTVYARPDLCPVSACKSLNVLLHRYIPSIGGFGAVAALPLAATPANPRLSVMEEKSATTTVTLTNPSAAAEAWQATTDLAWLTVSPASGTLDANASVTLTLTAKPSGINPGTYPSALTVTASGLTTRVPVIVVVAAAAQLRVTPQSLAFQACGTQQTLTIKNAGDAPLSFTASPSASPALSVSVSQQSLAPGASATVAVTLTCQATQGHSYAITVISNGGSVSVPVTYGA